MNRHLVLALLLLISTVRASADDIHKAVRRNDLAAVKALLDADPALVRHTTEDKQTPMHEAAAYVTADMVELLLTYNPDVNAVAYNKFTPLHLARDSRTAKLLLDAGADVDAVDSWNQTPLQNAATEGRRDVVEAILAKGTHLDLVSALRLGRREDAKAIIARFPGQANSPRKGWMTLRGNSSPLGIAAYQGDTEIINLILDAGANVNDSDRAPNMFAVVTPLSSAVWGGRTEAVKLLLDRGATTNCAGGKYYSLIADYALSNSTPEIFELLLKHGALKNEDPFDGKLSLAKVAAQGNAEKLAIYLRYAEKEAEEQGVRNALLAAAMHGHRDAVDSLIAAGATPDIFVWAVVGHLEGVKACVAADPSLVGAEDDTVGRTALSWALACRRFEVARWLLDNGAKAGQCTNPAKPGLQALLSAPDKFALKGPPPPQTPTECPLLLALGMSTQWPEVEATIDKDLVRKLVELGADVNGADYRGETALMRAARLKDPDIVRLLLERGADVGKLDSFKQGALHGGLTSREVTRLLLDAGANPNALSPDGQTVLDTAAQYGAPGVVEDLIAAGAQVTMYSSCVLGKEDAVRDHLAKRPELVNTKLPGGTPLKPVVVAARYGQVGVLGVLLKAGAELETDEHMADTPLVAAARARKLEGYGSFSTQARR